MPRSKSKPAPRRRRSSDAFDTMHMELLHAQAAVMVCALALQDSGVHHNTTAIVLRGVHLRLATIKQTLEEESKRQVRP